MSVERREEPKHPHAVKMSNEEIASLADQFGADDWFQPYPNGFYGYVLLSDRTFVWYCMSHPDAATDNVLDLRRSALLFGPDDHSLDDNYGLKKKEK